jgi:cytochrome c oxidase subunit 2
MRHRALRSALVGVVCLLALPGSPASPRATIAAAQAPEPRTIDVVARRFAFEPAEIQVTVGERVRLLVRTADGLHGIEIKKVKIAKEIPRGNKPVSIDFTADEAGRYPILCSEYCGDGHDDMKGTLVVLAKDAAPVAPSDPPAPQK